MIRLTDVSHRFAPRGAWVLRGLSLDVAEGECVGVAGASGSGRSTLLRVVATLLEPTRGGVEIDGVDAVAAPESVRARVGYCPHEPAPSRAPSARASLEFLADAWRVDRRVVDDVLELADLTAHGHRAPATLSTGERRRLGFAQALLHDPAILVLDDPLSDVDPRTRDALAELLAELASLGKTLVLGAAEPELVAGLCARVLTLDAGSLTFAVTDEGA